MADVARIEIIAVGPEVPRTTWASMPPQYMTLVLVRVWDRDGAEGMGATKISAAGMFDLSSYESVRALAPRILGKEALNREQRWVDLQTYVRPTTPGAVGALDIALWDLAARRAGFPMYQFLGGVRSEIEAYASTPELRQPDTYIDEVARLREEGFRAIKFHAWNIPDRDLTMLRKVHAEYADAGFTFMHDAENRYDRLAALRVGRELEEMQFRWFEAPLVDYDLVGYAELRQRVHIPIVPHGHWFSDLRELRYALDHRPWDAVRFDTTVIGGFTPALKACALAEAYGLLVEPESWGYSFIQAPNLHLDLAMKHVSYFELPVPYEPYEFAVTNPFRPDAEGRVAAPAGPGIGLEVDWDQIAASTLDRTEYSI